MGGRERVRVSHHWPWDRCTRPRPVLLIARNGGAERRPSPVSPLAQFRLSPNSMKFFFFSFPASPRMYGLLRGPLPSALPSLSPPSASSVSSLQRLRPYLVLLRPPYHITPKPCQNPRARWNPSGSSLRMTSSPYSSASLHSALPICAPATSEASPPSL
jgi:hypothetical protein